MMDPDAQPIEICTKHQFKENNDAEKILILKQKDKVNTQKATDGAVSQLKSYLQVKKLPNLEDLDQQTLASILYDFYPVVKPKEGEHYAVQTLKCLRARLARHFRSVKGIDITKDSAFTQVNEMFKAVTVQSKKHGKGVKKSYPPITQIDMERISEYFNHDHIADPSPKKLQRHLLFYVIYYFCHRGRENLYEMTKETFKLFVEYDSTEYVYQDQDETDKNHGPDDTNATNEGRMYGNTGKNMSLFQVRINSKKQKNKYPKKITIYKIGSNLVLTETTLCPIQVWKLYT